MCGGDSLADPESAEVLCHNKTIPNYPQPSEFNGEKQIWQLPEPTGLELEAPGVFAFVAA